MTPNEDIIRKIQKLLALGQSPNEAEATSAMAFAQTLLAKYNLDVAMINATHVAGGTVQPMPEKREKTRISRSAQYQWQRDLWKAICEANFCWYSVVEVYEGKRGVKGGSKVPVKRHMVLGRESNVIAVKMMGEYLEDTMERLVCSAGGYTNQERMSRGANSWKRGCADRLVERIEAQAEARKAEGDAGAAGGNALVLRSVYLTEYALNYDARYGVGAHARQLASSAEWEAGREAREAAEKAAEEKAEQDWLEFLQRETPEEKRKREREEEKERIKTENRRARSWRSWNRERREEASKIDGEAYRAGSRTAEKINLGAQVDAPGPKERRLK